MADYLIVGADVHEEYVMTKWCIDQGDVSKNSFRMTEAGQSKMIGMLHKTAKKSKVKTIVVAYEACCLGFGLHDRLTEASIECHVLAPTKIERSNKQHRDKTDEKDALRILEILRGHLLAGNSLPDIWIPDHQTRQDRAIIRQRFSLSEQCSSVKTKIRMILKRAHVRKPKKIGKNWTKAYRKWLRDICDMEAGVLQYGDMLVLESLLRQLKGLEDEVELQDHNIKSLSETPRYQEACAKLCQIKGVGLLTAMVFLTEFGDMSRFSNRRQIGAFLGLAPSSYETGENCDRKGHITKQGSALVRKVLSQAAWCISRDDAFFDRVLKKNPKKKKIAIVGVMRRTAIKMWHIALDVQKETGCFVVCTGEST